MICVVVVSGGKRTDGRHLANDDDFRKTPDSHLRAESGDSMSVMASALIACDHESGHHGNPRNRTVPATHSAQHQHIQRAQVRTLHHCHLIAHTHS